MGKHTTQKCPLCNTEAKYYLIDHGDKKYFRCPICTDFAISLDAEDHIAKMSTDHKKALTKQSIESDADEILDISINQMSMVHAEFRKRDSLKL